MSAIFFLIPHNEFLTSLHSSTPDLIIMHSAESWHMRKANFLVLCTVLCKLLISVFVVANVKGRIDKTHRFICKADGRTTASSPEILQKKPPTLVMASRPLSWMLACVSGVKNTGPATNIDTASEFPKALLSLLHSE